MNYFRTNFCDRIVCLVTSFSLGQFCLPFLPDCCTKCRFTEFFFFAFLSPVILVPFFFLLLYFLILFCPSLTTSFLSLHCPGWTSSFSLGFTFELLFCNLRLKKERIFIFLYSLLCQVRKGCITILFLTCTKCQRRQFTWSHVTDSNWIACLFILINTFREVIRLQPTVWGEGMGK